MSSNWKKLHWILKQSRQIAKKKLLLSQSLVKRRKWDNFRKEKGDSRRHYFTVASLSELVSTSDIMEENRIVVTFRDISGELVLVHTYCTCAYEFSFAATQLHQRFRARSACSFNLSIAQKWFVGPERRKEICFSCYGTCNLACLLWGVKARPQESWLLKLNNALCINYSLHLMM